METGDKICARYILHSQVPAFRVPPRLKFFQLRSMCPSRGYYGQRVYSVAQYLRMSTEHQQYSLENQAVSIQKYSEARNFRIVCTYSDAAKSGLGLKSRTGLRQLLQDLASGTA